MTHPTRTKPELYALVAEKLTAYGWKPIADPLPSGMASKEYLTAVGPKQAVATEFWPSNKDSVTLNGDYVSQGNNCLSCIFIEVRLDATDDEVSAAVEKYAMAVDKSVSGTYAMRLMRNRDDSATKEAN